MSYEINVSKGLVHFFATHQRSICDMHKLKEVFDALSKAFPECEGYEITVSEGVNYYQPVDGFPTAETLQLKRDTKKYYNSLTDMTRAEAKEAMQLGLKVSHSSFTDGGWITFYDDDVLIDQLGVKHNLTAFFDHRGNVIFDSGWYIFN